MSTTFCHFLNRPKFLKKVLYTYQVSDQITIQWLIKNLPQFLFPNLSLQQSRIEKPFMGILAIKDGQPIGLILANAESSQTIFRIHSFLVHPQFQNQRIGTNLLKKLEKEIKNRGGVVLEGTFKSHWKSVGYVRRILIQRNWKTPKPQLIVAKGKVKNALSFFANSSLLSSPFFLFPFTDLQKSDIDFIQKKQSQTQWFEPTFDPFFERATIERKCSFLLKKEAEIVGWIVTHRINSDIREITALFIDAEYRKFKIAYLMIQKVLQQLETVGILQFMVTSKIDGNAVAQLILREARKRDLFFTTSFYVCKQLK